MSKTKHGILDTSLEAYELVKPRLNEMQERVLSVFYEQPWRDWTNMEIAGRLGWSINRVTPRVYELRKLDILTQSQRRKCKVTKNNAYAWKMKCHTSNKNPTHLPSKEEYE
jgi:hypothetical protein